MVDPRARAADGLVLLPGFLDSYDNHILLCVHDGRLVRERRADFTPARLTQVKATHETEQAARVGGGAGSAVSLLVHTAVFLPSSPPHYASQDKDAVVRPLAHALQQRGLRVWYDEFELRLGASLRRRIDQGIARSAFGVVVLSPAFFAQDWPNYELDGLVNRAVAGGQVLLPLWHNVNRSEVERFSPPLADKVARDTAHWTPEQIAEEIVDIVATAKGTTRG